MAPPAHRPDRPAARERAEDERGLRADQLDGSGARRARPKGRDRPHARPGSGLVAAVRHAGDPPVWIVTGTDDAGVAAGARAFQAGDLHDDFALAVANDIGIPLPVAKP